MVWFVGLQEVSIAFFTLRYLIKHGHTPKNMFPKCQQETFSMQFINISCGKIEKKNVFKLQLIHLGPTMKIEDSE